MDTASECWYSIFPGELDRLKHKEFQSGVDRWDNGARTFLITGIAEILRASENRPAPALSLFDVGASRLRGLYIRVRELKARFEKASLWEPSYRDRHSSH